MLNKVVTLEQVLSWHPCYDRKKILRLSRGKTQLTIDEIIDLRFVLAEDKFWLLLREEIIPARTLHEFAIWCAETALTRAKVTDERSWNALKVKRLWLDGKATDKKLHAAWDAAWDAVRDDATTDATTDARDAAWYAAWDVARDAARDAARYAARDAAWGAAYEAAKASASVAAWETARRDAWATARKDQLAKLKEMLEGASPC